MRGRRRRMLMIRKFTYAWPHNQNYLTQSKNNHSHSAAITISVTGHLDRLSSINFHAMDNAYLIFVIFFTRAKFFENKIYTEKNA